MSESGSPIKKPHSRWFAHVRPRRFQYLLVIFLMHITVSPLMGEGTPARVVTALVSCLAMVQTCVAIIPRRRVLLISSLLALLVSIYGFLANAVHVPPFSLPVFQATFHVITIVFYAFAGIIVFIDVVRAGVVDTNKLCGCICFYILIGVIWGQFYQLCDVLEPRSFIFDMAKVAGHNPLTYFERANLLNYFSFVTLTTLGYGDVSPATRVTRTLAYIQAILGQLYIAILVSRLVGLHIAATRVSDTDE
jgi:voltage-gated potassium channel